MHNQYYSSMYSYNKNVFLYNIYPCMFYVLKLKLLQLQFHKIIKILLIIV
jgi:hypothetical protein